MISAGCINLVCYHHYEEEKRELQKSCESWKKEALEHLCYLREYEKEPPGTFAPDDMECEWKLAFVAVREWRRNAIRLQSMEDIVQCNEYLDQLHFYEEMLEHRRDIDELAWYTHEMISELQRNSKKADLEQPQWRSFLETEELDGPYDDDHRRHVAFLRDQLVNRDLHAETNRLSEETQRALRAIFVDHRAVLKPHAPLFDISDASLYNNGHDVVDRQASIGVLGTEETADAAKGE